MKKNIKGQVGFVALFLMIFIVVVVGVALLSPVASNVVGAQQDGNLSSQPAAVTVIGLSTLMFVLVIVGSVVGLTFLGLRAIGMV